MLGAPKESVLGSFDSKEEQSVARALFRFVREDYLRGVVPHPIVAGCEADFAVQIGPNGLEDQAVMFLEYDGLGMRRPRGLSAKQRKYARLRRNGLYVRWATSTDTEQLKTIFTAAYEPPHFVKRIRVCENGHEQVDIVIGEGTSEDEVLQNISRSKCDQCNGKTNNDASADAGGAS